MPFSGDPRFHFGTKLHRIILKIFFLLGNKMVGNRTVTVSRFIVKRDELMEINLGLKRSNLFLEKCSSHTPTGQNGMLRHSFDGAIIFLSLQHFIGDVL